MTIPLSNEALKALRGLRNEARNVQRSDVVTARKIEWHTDTLRSEIERLNQDNARFLKQITSGRAAERELMAEVVELRELLDEEEE